MRKVRFKVEVVDNYLMRQGLTRAKFLKMCGISRKIFNNLINGVNDEKRCPAIIIAAVMNVSVVNLFEIIEE